MTCKQPASVRVCDPASTRQSNCIEEDIALTSSSPGLAKANCTHGEENAGGFEAMLHSAHLHLVVNCSGGYCPAYTHLHMQHQSVSKFKMPVNCHCREDLDGYQIIRAWQTAPGPCMGVPRNSDRLFEKTVQSLHRPCVRAWTCRLSSCSHNGLRQMLHSLCPPFHVLPYYRHVWLSRLPAPPVLIALSSIGALGVLLYWRSQKTHQSPFQQGFLPKHRLKLHV